MNNQHFASLSPALLARKGGAKPAMRSQLGMMGATVPDGVLDEEDLGWNDLGEDVPASAQIFDFGAAQVRKPSGQPGVQDAVGGADRLLVKAKRSGKPRNSRTSFTLRLDAERHLMLRLACALQGCSAQQFVTGALDTLLATIPDIDKLAARTSRS
ncbi:type II toxin-antitoxin system HicB family antitoxin [Porphyrobacter sp. GA68]|uniref:type II toxin-antitoxin system HicB family antitoxin n=1 Tax=Porphyrobacter sp. GA68 TaxID=2883480 RepID=UPI001D1917DB|nr:type II toxin-antitoxin system HicB family antitoxin [Porphyrobacter sp. GA68]